ncbi:hypothetical protein AAC387_Pa09g0227 [Persea americana]
MSSPSWSPLSSRPPQTMFVAILIASIALFDTVDCKTKESGIDSKVLTSKIQSNRTIIVDPDGGEAFTSIQAAIDSIPEGNKEWIIVHLRPGLYREKIKVPKSKPYIFLRGNGKGKTGIVWNDTSLVNIKSATFTVEATNFVAWGISFKNEAPVGAFGVVNNRSVAAYVAADKVAFYHCAFYSRFNTLFDSKGRHYYDNCYITGSIDFIFGRARSIFNNCEVFVVADKRETILGSITAQLRKSPAEDSGMVFIGGKVYGIGTVYLGRARAAYSTVIFVKTYLSMAIFPEGWTNWSYDDSTDHLMLAEHQTFGPGATPDKRIEWSRQLSDKEAASFTSIDYIDGKGWLPAYQ